MATTELSSDQATDEDISVLDLRSIASWDIDPDQLSITSGNNALHQLMDIAFHQLSIASWILLSGAERELR